LAAAWEMCFAFDALCARARKAVEVNGFAPEIGGAPLAIRNGRHPLLVPSSPPFPLSVPERGDVTNSPSPEGRGGQGVRTDGAERGSVGDVVPFDLVLAPDEGAALAAAVLRTLTRRRVVTLATTHLGALKQLAAETVGIVNASLQFAAETLTPTYRLLKGVPGRSYGLAIARRLGIAADVLDIA